MDDWINWEWTKERPYPETEETIVRVILESDDGDEGGPCYSVREWDWGPYDGIIAYKVCSK